MNGHTLEDLKNDLLYSSHVSVLNILEKTEKNLNLVVSFLKKNHEHIEGNELESAVNGFKGMFTVLWVILGAREFLKITVLWLKKKNAPSKLIEDCQAWDAFTRQVDILFKRLEEKKDDVIFTVKEIDTNKGWIILGINDRIRTLKKWKIAIM